MADQPPRNRHRILKALAAVLLVFVAAIAVFLAVFDWNWLKGPIERRVADATGRELVIGGNIGGEWRLAPRLTFENVTFSNPEWSKLKHLLAAERVEIKISILPLLSKRVHIHDLLLQKPVLGLERVADGRATWRFDREQQDPESTPQIDSLRVDTGTLDYLDALEKAQLKVAFENDLDPNKPSGLQFSVKGRFRGEAVDARGSSSSLLEIREADGKLPLVLNGTIAGTQVSLKGETDDFPKLERMNLSYRVRGPSLKRLAPVFGVPLLETPAYDVAGQLNRAGNRWETTDMRGKVGTSDLGGTVVVVTGGEKPKLEANLHSKLLDLADLGPLIGTRPTGAPATPTENDRLLPTRTFDVSQVDKLDAAVKLKAQRIVRAADFPFDNFFADFKLKDSQVLIDPLEFGMADGKLRARVAMDARKQPLTTSLNGRVRDLRIAKIFPKQAALGEAAGSLDGSFDLKGRGNSIAQMAGTADGRTTLLLSDGRVPNLMPAIADLDGARIIISMLGRRPEYVQCAAVDLGWQAGVATPNVAVFETESTVLTLTGTANFADEALALKLSQAPKKPSFLSARTPILITGSMQDPAIAPDAGPLAARTAAVLLLGLINPLASLLATFEPGPGQEGTCPEMRRAIPRRSPGAAPGTTAKSSADKPLS
jgi:uncharacterized protein involved in outer membrane biogenesis